jgi:hypothetical protein
MAGWLTGTGGPGPVPLLKAAAVACVLLEQCPLAAATPAEAATLGAAFTWAKAGGGGGPAQGRKQG